MNSSRQLSVGLLLSLLAVGCASAQSSGDSEILSNSGSIPGPGPSAGAGGADAVPAESGQPAGKEPSVGLEASPEAKALVAASDRSAEDQALDGGRHPAEMLTFFGIKAGMRVAELGAGGGYTSELLARAVAPSGQVYGQNTKFILERFAEKPWSERLEKPVMKNVVRIDREFDDPLPAEVKDLDAVLVVLFYHDLYWLKANRQKMNARVFAALRPGGLYGIVDHSAREGAADSEVQSLHRIEEKTLRADVEKAGFVLDKEGSFLRNPDDRRDWNASPSAAGTQRGQSDRFVLTFRKPK